MPLLPCPECGRNVSDKAPTCPTCGHPIATVTQTQGKVIAALRSKSSEDSKASGGLRTMKIVSMVTIALGLVLMFGAHGVEAIGVSGVLFLIFGGILSAITWTLDWWQSK